MINKRIFFLILLILTIGIGIFFFLSFEVFNSSREALEEEVIFEIERGEGVFSIARRMSEKEIIGSEFLFLGYLFFSGEARSMQAGVYEIDPGSSVADIVDKFSSGKISYKDITIIEGWTIIEIASHLKDQEIISTKDEFIKFSGISEPQADLFGMEKRRGKRIEELPVLYDLPEGASLEGYLFPDAYRLSSNNPEKLIGRMIQNLNNKLEENFFSSIEDMNKSIHEVIIMASIIEKEVSDPEDMRKVSDILWRRMDVGMPLQVDATVNYITGRRDIRVTLNETGIDSKYNTYKNTGLPAGPISNPGMESIKAALNPTSNEYWYYLSDPETGKTIFSRNHSEHVEAKNLYLR